MKRPGRKARKEKERKKKRKGLCLWLINLGGVKRKERRQHSLSNEQSHNADNELADEGGKEGGREKKGRKLTKRVKGKNKTEESLPSKSKKSA